MAKPNMVVQNMTGTPHVQWDGVNVFMVKAFRKAEWRVEFNEPVPGEPNMVFGRNPGTVTGCAGAFDFTPTAWGAENGWTAVTDAKTKNAAVKAAAPDA